MISNINNYISITLIVLGVIVIIFVANLLMGELFKWFIRKPIWVKLSITSFIFCFIFWFPFVDHFFRNKTPQGITEELVWYKSLMYALVPSTIWYFLNLAFLYYWLYLMGEDLSQAHKQSIFWLAMSVDVLICFIILACIIVIANSNWIVFLLVLLGYKLLAFVVAKPILKALDEVL